MKCDTHTHAYTEEGEKENPINFLSYELSKTKEETKKMKSLCTIFCQSLFLHVTYLISSPVCYCTLSFVTGATDIRQTDVVYMRVLSIWLHIPLLPVWLFCVCVLQQSCLITRASVPRPRLFQVHPMLCAVTEARESLVSRLWVGSI